MEHDSEKYPRRITLTPGIIKHKVTLILDSEDDIFMALKRFATR